MDSLARFYTDNNFSDLLVDEINLLNPNLIIDLGIGDGALTTAAYKKWQSATFIASDIDLIQIRKTEKRIPFVKIIEANGLDLNLGKKLNIVTESVDIAVCNPPYLRLSRGKHNFNNLFERTGLGSCKYLKYITSDLVFLAQNILFLREGGILGIILPDGLLSNSEFKLFRNDLINNHTLLSIIQLPDRIFKKAEARTHILILKKGNYQEANFVNLYLANHQGKLYENLNIPSILLSERMDFNFHKLPKQNPTSTKTLDNIGAIIKRGRLTHSELKTQNTHYIHTTTLKHKCELQLIDDISENQITQIYTEPGDILLARVGRGCIGKVAKVLKGKQLISDCVYKIQVPKEYIEKTWKAFCSKSGQNWLKYNSHGVCSSVISKSALKNFPIKFL